MKCYLVIEEDNYADEFDISGFRLYEAESEEELKKRILDDFFGNYIEDEEDEEDLQATEFPINVYFGTNECIEIEDEEEFFRGLRIEEISYFEYTAIQRTIGEDFGTLCRLRYWY